jgi:hypothetical protein
MAKKKRSVKLKRPKMCDPAICSCCQYIGEGDFVCDKYMEIVVSDWEPTEDYLLCEQMPEVE